MRIAFEIRRRHVLLFLQLLGMGASLVMGVFLLACGLMAFNQTFCLVHQTTEPADLYESICYCISFLTISFSALPFWFFFKLGLMRIDEKGKGEKS